MQKPLSVGVVGAGRMGSLHLKKLSSLPYVNCVGSYDPFVPLAKFKTLEELAFEADAVVIASPTPTHFAVTKKLLELDVDVFVEKPMCETLEEAMLLVKIAEERKRVLQVGFLERFRLRKLLSGAPQVTPRFVATERFATSVGREPEIDVVSDLMIHDIDLVLSLFSSEPIKIQASGVSIVTDCIDIAQVRLDFSDGNVAFLSASRVSAKNRRKVSIATTGTQISMDFLENEVNIFSKSRAPHFCKLEGVDPLHEELTEFVGACVERRTPVVSGIDAIRSLRVRDTILAEIRRTGFQKGLESTQIVPEAFA